MIDLGNTQGSVGISKSTLVLLSTPSTNSTMGRLRAVICNRWAGAAKSLLVMYIFSFFKITGIIRIITYFCIIWWPYLSGDLWECIMVNYHMAKTEMLATNPSKDKLWIYDVWLSARICGRTGIVGFLEEANVIRRVR